MKEYDVSLDVVADSSVASKVAQQLGVKTEFSSWKKSKQGTLWKIESGRPKKQPLNDHIVSILSKIKGRKPCKTEGLVKGIVLNVGVFYDTITCTINFPSKSLTKLISRFPDIIIEVTCYPIG
jgi:hypothetical protein